VDFPVFENKLLLLLSTMLYIKSLDCFNQSHKKSDREISTCVLWNQIRKLVLTKVFIKPELNKLWCLWYDQPRTWDYCYNPVV